MFTKNGRAPIVGEPKTASELGLTKGSKADKDKQKKDDPKKDKAQGSNN